MSAPDRPPRDPLLEASLALGRTIELDAIGPELARQLRATARAEALALAVVDGVADGAADDARGGERGRGAAAPRLVHHTGFPDDDAAALTARLAPAWAEARASGRVVATETAAGLELTAPVPGTDGPLGAMTTLVRDAATPPQHEELQRVVAGLAAQAGAAVERARLVRRLTHRQRQDAAAALAAGAAHELRTPLTGIASAAQLLRFRAREDPVVEKNVGRILREVERLSRVATVLLEYGRPEPVRLAPGDPEAVWDAVLAAHRGQLESRALAVARTRAQPPARCALDATQLGQAFATLLGAAIDAAPEASDLALHGETLPDGTWRCRLHRAGPPIPADALPHVFQLFAPAAPGGSGIGLALCQRVVEAHDGTIGLASDAAQGTTVTVTLPPARGG
ncbi:MAG TPA: HAMP domain-containing sensor histidine kinase [Gemmatimonadaceae bacterium]|nr:HAMP domain-containing sensor histidine kinase [Gemmatimonadaceae bacterium]